MSRGGMLTPGTGFNSISTQTVSMANTPCEFTCYGGTCQASITGNNVAAFWLRQMLLKSQPHRSHKSVLDLRICRYSELIASTNDEVLPRRKVETTQN